MENTRKNPNNFYSNDVDVAMRIVAMTEAEAKNEVARLCRELLDEKRDLASFFEEIDALKKTIKKVNNDLEYLENAYDIREEELKRAEEANA